MAVLRALAKTTVFYARSYLYSNPRLFIRPLCKFQQS